VASAPAICQTLAARGARPLRRTLTSSDPPQIQNRCAAQDFAHANDFASKDIVPAVEINARGITAMFHAVHLLYPKIWLTEAS
jgi:hypothetical protein